MELSLIKDWNFTIDYGKWNNNEIDKWFNIDITIDKYSHKRRELHIEINGYYISIYFYNSNDVDYR